MSELLVLAGEGDASALGRAFPLVYDELRHLARRQLRLEPDGHTLDTTGLVHEAYLRLVDQTRVRWADRGHFLAVASTAMRRILVDHARRHRAAKRGSAPVRVALDRITELPAEARAEFLIALDAALARLAELSPRQAQVIECRFFGGLTETETAEALGIGVRTAKRDWAKARGWLYRELDPEGAA